ncbi:MAG TPA: aldo/keto reductase [Burkholderiales bacterium]|nr:aldo/keto reductase [Burkholderiales bacterium]
MELRPFGRTKRPVPVVGQGTWYIDRADKREAIAALQRGIDLGMTHVDTAEMYGDAELLVAAAIAGRRDEVFLVDKVLPQHASKKDTLVACHRSLKRLHTDRLECYLLHWRGNHPLADTFSAFEHLCESGAILSWGVSNFDENDLDDAWRAGGRDRLACNQVLYHLKERAIEHAVIPWCQQHDVAVVAYAPYGHGDFPGPNTEGGRLLQQIAAAHDGATPRQVALRFLLRWPNTFTIPKASTPRHAKENAGAGDLRLTDDEIERIDRAFPRDLKPRTLPMI